MENDQALIIQHFNSDNPLKVSLVSNSIENFCTVKVIDKSSLIIKKGDPIILGLMNDESQIKILGGNIIGASVDANNINHFIITTDKEFLSNDKRQFQRYPVSVYGSYKREGLNNIFGASIKDISCNGLRFYSTEDVQVGEIIHLDIIFKDTKEIFTCQVLRKGKYFDRFEYGLSILHKDRNSMSAAEAFITF